MTLYKRRSKKEILNKIKLVDIICIIVIENAKTKEMESIKMEILPKKGLGNVEFGNYTRILTKKLGSPQHVEEISTDDDLKTTVLSFENGITVFLEGLIDPVVSNIDIDNRNATLFGEKVFDLEEKGIKDLMHKNGYSEIEEEEEEWGETRLTFDDAMMDFYFESGKLVAVSWGVEIGEGGEVIL